mmetsp:Transcript_27228/g.55581  ORF Transcript_27228/g.55581 Transcript_27228/m.55581 type:complete len:103 (-) Transcript_27228:539-847(-)
MTLGAVTIVVGFAGAAGFEGAALLECVGGSPWTLIATGLPWTPASDGFLLGSDTDPLLPELFIRTTPWDVAAIPMDEDDEYSSDECPGLGEAGTYGPEPTEL